ncbi:MAG: hypothetical protein CM15mP77_1530 [Synechococcus sp.]|nr:MAG: hypothetical protein CM15mP77_1530 [Synechococcus sp.]
MPRQPSVAHCTSRSQLEPGKTRTPMLMSPAAPETSLRSLDWPAGGRSVIPAGGGLRRHQGRPAQAQRPCRSALADALHPQAFSCSAGRFTGRIEHGGAQAHKDAGLITRHGHQQGCSNPARPFLIRDQDAWIGASRLDGWTLVLGNVGVHPSCSSCGRSVEIPGRFGFKLKNAGAGRLLCQQCRQTSFIQARREQLDRDVGQQTLLRRICPRSSPGDHLRDHSRMVLWHQVQSDRPQDALPESVSPSR